MRPSTSLRQRSCFCRQAAGLGQAVLFRYTNSGGERELLIDLADQGEGPFRKDLEYDDDVARRSARAGPKARKSARRLGHWPRLREPVQRLPRRPHGRRERSDWPFSTDLRDGSYLGDGFAAAALSAAKRTTKPIAYATNYTQVRHDKLALALSNAGVPVLDGTTNALAAVRGVLAYRDFRERLNVSDPVPAVQPRQDWANTFRNGPRSGALPEDDALSLLADFDIPVVRHRRVSSAVEAVEAARQIGFPVALKTAKPGVTHKSEHGGVALAYGMLLPWRMPTAISKSASDQTPLLRHDVSRHRIVTGYGPRSGFWGDRYGRRRRVLIELLADRRVGLALWGEGTALGSSTLRGSDTSLTVTGVAPT